jgi:hypothetical protein
MIITRTRYQHFSQKALIKMSVDDGYEYLLRKVIGNTSAENKRC